MSEKWTTPAKITDWKALDIILKVNIVEISLSNWNDSNWKYHLGFIKKTYYQSILKTY